MMNKHELEVNIEKNTWSSEYMVVLYMVEEKDEQICELCKGILKIPWNLGI